MIITGKTRVDGIRYHQKATCKGQFCTLHNPSKHKMRDWPMNLRPDRLPLIERMCPHGIGHPDPDSVNFIERNMAEKDKGYTGVHGCDGCCFRN